MTCILSDYCEIKDSYHTNTTFRNDSCFLLTDKCGDWNIVER